MTRPLAELLSGDPFVAYSYSYPHKTAYRALDPPVALGPLWAAEDRRALFLYVHVPFCEQRCGFCNLFTASRPPSVLVDCYLEALERQAAVMGPLLAPATFVRMAVGGGTPTYLDPPRLERLLGVAARLGARSIPSSVEVSPGTADGERLAVLRRAGTTRISIGLQSFLPAETAAVARHQDPATVERALAAIATTGFPVRNIDLIYGIPGQTPATLGESIDRALGHGANELYLYPLYVRPLTTAGQRRVQAADRQALYRAGRDHLRRRGWSQVTMRCYRAPGACADPTPEYRCQDDGMVGLGPGARSYARTLHYSSPYAVAQDRVRTLVEDWCASPDAGFAVARHGFHLDAAERRRRDLILSLLEEGVDEAGWARRHGVAVATAFPELAQALDLGLVAAGAGRLRLTDDGRERSDLLGHWLYSAAVRERMAAHEAV